MKSYNILRLCVLSIALMLFIHAAGGPIEDGRKLFLAGEYEQAEMLLKSAVKKSPRDGNANYYYGATLVALERPLEALEPLRVAEGRGVADASRLLAEIEFDQYEAQAASAHLDKWAAALRKARKPLPEEYEELQKRVVLMRNMLERVERIEVVDSLIVDADDFFQAYRLAAEAGRLTTPDLLPVDDASVVYVPQLPRELIWSAPDSVGTYQLMTSGILDDGSLENAQTIAFNDLDGANVNYPFMMPDGQTLYFASDGGDSLGGYDIFLTRRNPNGGFYEPQNVGMPYNSPYDDYMLAIDETTGLGWWATDRNRIPGKVTIYVFRPNDMRVNCDPDDPYLAFRARLNDIELTQSSDADYQSLKRLIHSPAPAPSQLSTLDRPTIAMAMGNGRVYRSLDDFRSQQARQAMQQLLATEGEIRGLQQRLESLRLRYARGEKNLGVEITTLEDRLQQARRRQRQLSNTVVTAENARK